MFGPSQPQRDLHAAEQQSRGRHARLQGDAARSAELGVQRRGLLGSIRQGLRRLTRRKAVEQ
jgi:hypothetical protein